MHTETKQTIRCYNVLHNGIRAVDVSEPVYFDSLDLFWPLTLAREKGFYPQKPRVAPRTAVGVVRAEGGVR